MGKSKYDILIGLPFGKSDNIPAYLAYGIRQEDQERLQDTRLHSLHDLKNKHAPHLKNLKDPKEKQTFCYIVALTLALKELAKAAQDKEQTDIDRKEAIAERKKSLDKKRGSPRKSTWRGHEELPDDTYNAC